MFKILITTRYWSSSGVGIHSVMVEFETFDEAQQAIERVVEQPKLLASLDQIAIALY